MSSESLTVNAPAKINLFLEIGGRRPDGYHNIESVMQSVSLYDVLTFEKTDGETTLACSVPSLIYDGNLACRAARLFYELTDIKGGVRIGLKKHIPVSAGLGGGSTDAAATLSAMNRLYGDPLSKSELHAAARSLGADVPFCLERGLCRARGIGDELERLGRLPDCTILISKGDSRVSTKKAYETLDRVDHRVIRSCEPVAEAIAKGSLEDLSSGLYNAFEQIGDFDGEIKRIMKAHNAVGAVMSGSGPSVLGIYRDPDDAREAERILKGSGRYCFICKPEYGEI